MLPEGWSMTRLGDVLRRESRPVTVSASATYQEIGIRSHCKGIFHKPKVLGKALGEKRVFEVIPEALVLNIVFAWEQAIAVSTSNEIGLIASHRFPMYRPISDLCDVNYLRHYFSTARGKELLETASPGGAGRNKTLGQKNFEDIRVPMPISRSEQTRIADVLTAWDKAIAVRAHLLANSRKRKQALIEILVSGNGPNSSANWRASSVGQLASVTVSSVNKKHEDGERRVLLCNYTDVYHNESITSDLPLMAATASQSEIAKFSVRRGDVLITKDSETPSDIAISSYVADDIPDLVCGYHLAILRADSAQIDPEFLHSYFALRRTRTYFASQANGATRFGLPIAAIQGAPIQFPDIQEQRRIARVIGVVTREIACHERDMDALKAEKSALIQQLLAGHRRVRMAESAKAALT